MRFKRISRKLIRDIKGQAWNIESREAHEKGHLKPIYAGSTVMSCTSAEMREQGARRIRDYYQDEEGNWWWDERVLTAAGRIVTMEQWLFGDRPRRKQVRYIRPVRGRIRPAPTGRKEVIAP